jgi:hypothetical protein
LVRRKVTFAGEDVKLSPTEFNLLRLLVTHAGCVLTHRQIMRALRGESAEHDVQYLRVYVRLLRRKIEPDPARPRYIRTEPGVGYHLLCERDIPTFGLGPREVDAFVRGMPPRRELVYRLAVRGVSDRCRGDRTFRRRTEALIIEFMAGLPAIKREAAKIEEELTAAVASR